MKLNRKWLMVIALVMSLTMATAGTLAYLTDRDTEVNVFTMGNVDIELEEDFEQGAELIPGLDIEKEPTITNVGPNDAWVWATIAIPAALDNDDASKNVLHFNMSKESVAEGKWTWWEEGTRDKWLKQYNVENEGIKYNVFTVLYQTALKKGDTTEPVIYKVYMDPHVDIAPDGELYHVENGEATKLNLNINKDGNPKIYVSAYAMQTDKFDNVYEAYAAYTQQWGTGANENAIAWGTPDAAIGGDNANEDLEDALTSNEESIVVKLEKDVEYDVAAWQNNVMGGENTKSITIIGNGHTITFNNTNSDWNHVVTGDAVLTIKNATINNAGHNATSGTWNGHDITFAGEVKFEDVVFENAIALMNTATLKNVTLTDDSTGDAYGIWIRPLGQTVTIDGLKMDMTTSGGDDRGIKVDNQYATDADKGVNLTVKNATIKTDKKAAILVKSTGVVNVTTENVTFTGATTDLVQVDSDVASNQNNIFHNGVVAPLEP